MRRLKAIGALVAVGLLAAACSAGKGGGNGGSNGNGSTKATNTVTISNENGALWTCNFSPFNGSDTLLSVGFVYEPVVYVNALQNGKTTPMLATSWKWGSGNTSLTFTIRSGVKFSDGTPMTAADVVYTFNLIKKYPALDLTGDWAVLSSVTQSGSNQVVMKFKHPAVPAFYYIAGQTPIVPQHIWSKISNPVSYPDSSPVGTGPYKVNPCTKSNITYTANPHYWQPGLPKVTKVQYPAFTSNNTANDQLANGQAQWGSQYIPSIKSFYTAKSPNFHYWFPPTVNVSLIPNLKNPLLANVKVRQAMSDAIDRAKVSSIGESGYEPPANPPGRHRHADVLQLAELLADQQVQLQLQPSQGEADTGLGRVQDGLRRHHGEFEGPEALLLRHQHRRLLRLGRLDAGGRPEPQGGRYPGDAGQPEQHRLHRLPLHGQVPARLLRPADFRPEPVLRAAELAGLGGYRAHREDGDDQLRAVQQPGHGQAVQRVRRVHLGGAAAFDHEPGGTGHARRPAHHPGGPGR